MVWIELTLLFHYYSQNKICLHTMTTDNHLSTTTSSGDYFRPLLWQGCMFLFWICLFVFWRVLLAVLVSIVFATRCRFSHIGSVIYLPHFVPYEYLSMYIVHNKLKHKFNVIFIIFLIFPPFVLEAFFVIFLQTLSL